MKKTLRITSIILTIAMLMSLFCIAGTVSAGAASKSNKVQLYSASVYFSKYGGKTYEVFVQTKGNADDEEVYIHYNYLDYMGWQDAKADLYTTLSDGTKIWRSCFSSFNTKYCIKYIADGKTYWDNNNGKDYNGTERIGAATIAADRLGYQYGGWGGYRIDAVLKNLAYHKNVFVRYTTNNWRTHHDVAMHYSETRADGTETWTTNLDVNFDSTDRSAFHYAICYRVNGKEYWANHFGNDYDGYFHINH